jgi:hypothetical protein
MKQNKNKRTSYDLRKKKKINYIETDSEHESINEVNKLDLVLDLLTNLDR